MIALLMELHLFGYSAQRNHPGNIFLKLLAMTSLLIQFHPLDEPILEGLV
jgi:hypothetical protein